MFLVFNKNFTLAIDLPLVSCIWILKLCKFRLTQRTTTSIFFLYIFCLLFHIISIELHPFVLSFNVEFFTILVNVVYISLFNWKPMATSENTVQHFFSSYNIHKSHKAFVDFSFWTIKQQLFECKRVFRENLLASEFYCTNGKFYFSFLLNIKIWIHSYFAFWNEKKILLDV